jgi:hypothetical protein
VSVDVAQRDVDGAPDGGVPQRLRTLDAAVDAQELVRERAGARALAVEQHDHVLQVEELRQSTASRHGCSRVSFTITARQSRQDIVTPSYAGRKGTGRDSRESSTYHLAQQAC